MIEVRSRNVVLSCPFSMRLFLPCGTHIPVVARPMPEVRGYPEIVDMGVTEQHAPRVHSEDKRAVPVPTPSQLGDKSLVN